MSVKMEAYNHKRLEIDINILGRKMNNICVCAFTMKEDNENNRKSVCGLSMTDTTIEVGQFRVCGCGQGNRNYSQDNSK